MTAAVAAQPEALAVQSPDWHYVDALTLAALPSAVPCARLLVQYALSNWHIDRRVIDMADTMVAELMRHAVASTGIVDPLPSYSEAFDQLTLIDVRLQLAEERLLITIHDTDAAAPNAHRDLSQVLLHSENWGWYRPSRGGRAIWCSLRTVPVTSSLPRRIRAAAPPRTGEPIEPMRDPDLLQRVLDRLRALGDPDEQEE